MKPDQQAPIFAFGFAGAFLLATVLGFIPNPLVGDGALFQTNTAHNMVHLATAAGFLVVGLLGNRASTLFMKSFGVVYLLVGVLGFYLLGGASEGHLLGVVHINTLDNYLHLVLGAVILLSGFYLTKRSDSESDGNSGVARSASA